MYKILSRLTLGLVLSASPYLFADGGERTSLFQHQTDAGKWEVTPGLSYGQVKFDHDKNKASFPFAAAAVTETKYKTTVAQVVGEYGINKMFSAGLRLAYETDSIEVTPASTYDPNSGKDMKAKGMSDPEIYMHGRSGMGEGCSLRYGFNLRWSPGKHKIDRSGTEENQYSGGTTFTPYIGYEKQMGTHAFGTRLKYDLIQTPRKVQNDSSAQAAIAGLREYQVEQGNNTSLFFYYEMDMQPWIWGVDLGVVHHQHSKVVFSQPIGGTSNVDGQDHMVLPALDLYASYRVSERTEILPKLGLNSLNTNQGYLSGAVAQDKMMAWYASVSGRFSF